MIMPGSCHFRWLAALVAVHLCLAGPRSGHGRTIEVAAEAERYLLRIGETTRLIVTALIEEPGGIADGVFTYDLDLLLGEPGVLGPVAGSVTRPDVDDAAFGGSDGTLAPWGLNAIAGGYWQMGLGVGAPHALFTIDLLAQAVGTCVVAVGPDTDVMGADFVLYEPGPMTVDYSKGVAVFHVIPEPTPWRMLALGVGLLLLRPGRLRRAGIRSILKGTLTTAQWMNATRGD